MPHAGMRYLVALALMVAVVSCHRHPVVVQDGGVKDGAVPVMDAAPADGGSDAVPMLGKKMMLGSKAGPSSPKLTISNKCSYGIWMQQQNMPTSTPAVMFVAANSSVQYDIPAAGLASTRFWPKAGCDAQGQNCTMGQSSPPCPAKGCLPPVDSKIEATWGCTLKDPTQCAMTPQGNRIDATTWWNASAVDGYTLPFTITTSGGDGRKACSAVDCEGLLAAGCPTDDDLSTGGKFPQYRNQDEHVTGGGSWQGCFSTCMKLNYPTYGGDNGGAPQNPGLQMYCCPTPPVSSPACQAGPVAKTKYVEAIHRMCKKTVYGYAYDDGVGLRNCSADTSFLMQFGPTCP